MPPRFKSPFKRIVAVFLILSIQLHTNAQDSKLQPELDINTGLQSNAVRCIKLDSKNTAWVGTDNGLNILNANTVVQTNIIAAIGNKSIWGIEMLDSLVFIGTLNDGLYIFNQFTGKLYKYFPATAISLIRKIKVFNKGLFILTNKGPYKWTTKGLNKILFTSKVDGDFAIDMFEWKDGLYALAYPSSQIVKYYNDSFTEDESDLLFGMKRKIKDNYFSSKAFGNKLVLGGVFAQVNPNPNQNSITVIEASGITKSYTLSCNFPGANIVIWDIAIIKDKIILAAGDTRTNGTGQLYILDTNLTKIEVNKADYITCLALDSINNCLYYGTLNNGLLIQKGISGCKSVYKPIDAKLMANENGSFFFNNKWIQNTGAFNLKPLNKIITNKSKFDSEAFVNLMGDTIVFASNGYLKIWKSSLRKLINEIKIIEDNTTSAIQTLNGNIYCFDNYGGVHSYNISSGKSELLKNVQSFIPYPQRFGDKILLLNKEKGFSIIKDNESYPLGSDDKSIPFVTDFTVIQDTLYTLNRSEVKAFLIDNNKQKITLLKSFFIDSIIEGFKPKWLIAKNSKFYILNDNGIIAFQPYTGKPINYFYLGNYNQIDKPIPIGDSIIFSSGNYLTKISFREIENANTNVDEKELSVSFPESVNENLAFKLGVNYPDYLHHNRYLKSIEIWHNGKIVITHYSVNAQFTFNNGMNYGDYDFVVRLGKAKLKSKIAITLPLNRNPYFFGAIIFFVLVIISLIIKSQFDKRELNKKLNQNRLQILKQNLNPHFVFNSMNLISSLILENKNDEAVQVVADFSSLQRTYLETNNKESISLQEELNFLNAYLKLQQKRFHHDNVFTYTINLGDEVNANSITLPPLVLQPLAENAIKYGVIGSMAPEKRITVDISGTNPLVIGIEDNGEQVDTSINKGLGLGHQIVLERVNLFTKANKKNIKILFNQPALHTPSGYRVEIHIYK